MRDVRYSHAEEGGGLGLIIRTYTRKHVIYVHLEYKPHGEIARYVWSQIYPNLVPTTDCFGKFKQSPLETMLCMFAYCLRVSASS